MLTTSTGLLDRLRQAGNGAAWQRFVELYGPLLLAWARRLGLPAADADDLVQEVLAVLLVKLPDYSRQAEGSFRAWLKTVTRNKWLELQRKRRPEPVGDSRDLPAAPDASEKAWDEEYRKYVVCRALDLMKSDFQPATWQTAWEVIVSGRSAAEVGAQFGMTAGAVHAARFRVLTRLRRELAGMLDE